MIVFANNSTDGTVRHKYQQPGSETIEVTASNNVSSVTSYAFVEVVEQIQSECFVVAKTDVFFIKWMQNIAITTSEKVLH